MITYLNLKLLVVRLESGQRQSLADVQNLLIPTPGGTQIPLNQVADVCITGGPNQIQREDAKRRIIVCFNVRGRDIKTVVNELEQKVDKQLKFPLGFFVTYGGAFENLQAAQKRLSIARNVSVVKVGHILFVLIALSSVIATQTGESAEPYLKSIKAVDETILETHVQAADIANYAMIAVGVVSLLTLLLKRLRTVVYMCWITLVLSIIALLLIARAGNLGGEIMHKEIRSNAINTSTKN